MGNIPTGRIREMSVYLGEVFPRKQADGTLWDGHSLNSLKEEDLSNPLLEKTVWNKQNCVDCRVITFCFHR